MTLTPEDKRIIRCGAIIDQELAEVRGLILSGSTDAIVDLAMDLQGMMEAASIPATAHGWVARLARAHVLHLMERDRDSRLRGDA